MTATTQAPVRLTRRELEVLLLVAEGLSDQEIADRLHFSLRTANFHCANIREKLGVRNRMQCVNRARRLGLLGGEVGR